MLLELVAARGLDSEIAVRGLGGKGLLLKWFDSLNMCTGFSRASFVR